MLQKQGVADLRIKVIASFTASLNPVVSQMIQHDKRMLADDLDSVYLEMFCTRNAKRYYPFGSSHSETNQWRAFERFKADACLLNLKNVDISTSRSEFSFASILFQSQFERRTRLPSSLVNSEAGCLEVRCVSMKRSAFAGRAFRQEEILRACTNSPLKKTQHFSQLFGSPGRLCP